LDLFSKLIPTLTIFYLQCYLTI
jgi:hypothetical protein